MTRWMALPCLVAATLSAACGRTDGEQRPNLAAATPAPPDWRAIATADDRRRLREWRTAWMAALAKARAAGFAAEIARAGILLQPDAAATWENPPPGDYRCRMIKLGGKSAGLLDYIAYPPFNCRISLENGLMSFAKLTGSQRPLGLFLPYVGQRMVFLGTLQLGDEERSLDYGEDRERDVAAVVERLGPSQWRLVFPYPHFESTVDVLELVPRTPGA